MELCIVSSFECLTKDDLFCIAGGFDGWTVLSGALAVAAGIGFCAAAVACPATIPAIIPAILAISGGTVAIPVGSATIISGAVSK